LNKVFDFLGLGHDFSDDMLKKIHARLDQDNFKQNTSDIYNKIPNIIEINAELSKNGFGSLF